MSLGWLVVKQVVAYAAEIVAEFVAEHFVGQHSGAVVAVAGVGAAEQPLVAVHCVEPEPEPEPELATEPAAAAAGEPVDGSVAGLVEGGLAD